jgi:hypothetical protein
MKKTLVLTIMILALPAVAAAQASNDYNKLDIYAGYSMGRFTSNVRQATFTSSGGSQTFSALCSVATGQELGPNSQKFFCARRNFNGFDAAVTGNVSRYIGLTGDVTGHWKKTSYLDNFTPPGVNQTLANDEKLWSFLGGVQFKDNSRSKRVKPFGHVLAGLARYSNQQTQTLDLFPAFNFVIEDRFTSFAMKIGGGLDIRVGKRVDIRVIQADYTPVMAKDRNARRISGPFTPSFVGRTMNGLTIGAGIVIH